MLNTKCTIIKRYLCILSLHLNNFQRFLGQYQQDFSLMLTLYGINVSYYFYILWYHFSKVILTTEEVITAIFKVISATTKVILATEEVIIATLNVISATTKVILATAEVITTPLKVTSTTTKAILATEEVNTATLTVFSSTTNVILATDEVIPATVISPM